MTAPSRPVLRYYGGKFRLSRWIISYFPEHDIYVEPFAGAASVLLAKPRARAEVLNDLSEDIVNLFAVLRDPVTALELRRVCTLTPWSRTEFERSYDPTDDAVERARRTVVRGFMGFGSAGASRKGRTGFRVYTTASSRANPANEWVGWPAVIPAICERLAGVVIERKDARRLIAEQDGPRTLIYADPPYVMASRRDARGYYEHEMTERDHEQLAESLHAAEGMVVLSGYHSPLYDRLYAGWQRHERLSAADNGGGRGAGKTRRVEVLWLNPACAAARECAA
jgi:DNA adenine methylase